MSKVLNSEVFAAAALHGINSSLREALREQFQKEADKVIKEAIDNAMQQFETHINMYRDNMMMEDIMRVILVDRRSK